MNKDIQANTLPSEKVALSTETILRFFKQGGEVERNGIDDEKVAEKIHEIKNDFWVALGQLVADHLQRAPDPKYMPTLLRRMQDSASLYGTDCTDILWERGVRW